VGRFDLLGSAGGRREEGETCVRLLLCSLVGNSECVLTRPVCSGLSVPRNFEVG
jgi:hypothetical protein